MTISDLIDQLAQYDPELEVGMVVSYTEHTCSNEDYCYCSSQDHEYDVESVSKQEEGKTKNKKIVKIWIRGGQ